MATRRIQRIQRAHGFVVVTGAPGLLQLGAEARVERKGNGIAAGRQRIAAVVAQTGLLEDLLVQCFAQSHAASAGQVFGHLLGLQTLEGLQAGGIFVVVKAGGLHAFHQLLQEQGFKLAGHLAGRGFGIGLGGELE